MVRALTALGRSAEAAAAAGEAVAAAADVGAADLEADAALAAAAAHLAAGDADACRADAERALERSWRFGRFLSDAEGSSARARVASAALYGVEACLARADLAGAFAFAERGRAVALAESLGLRDALSGAHATPAAVAEEEAARSAEALAAAALEEAVAAGERAVVKARRLDLEAARSRHLDLLGRFAADAKSRAGLAFPAVASAAEVRGALGADEAYVAYVTNGTRGLAIVATAAGLRVAPLPPLPVLEGGLGPDDPGTLEAFRAAIVAPLALPATVRRVVVCPMGATLDVPYAALLPDVDVAIAPSAGIWLRQRAEAARTGKGVLAVGDPDYDGSARGAPRPTTWVRLPGTGVEAKAVGTEVLLRGDATEARFRAAVVAQPRWSAVHLACHGSMDLRQPLRSALALAPEAGDDGLLTAAEVYRLPVRADLVVLSGCETARAQVVEGEGPLGLARAFFVAGAPRVIVALWKVDDAATSALMQAFHARFRAGASAATALREAQATVRAEAKWAAPRYWAAWQLHGVW
ncbi:MAG: CHAT domain-containing protein [Planctomycetota bacterium]